MNYKKMKNKKITSFLELLIVWKKSWKLHFFDFWGFENRNESVKKILKESLSDTKIPDFKPVIINTWDRPFNKCFNVNVFSFCTADWYKDKILPDFLYDSWEAAKIPDFDVITEELIWAWEKKPKINKIWRIWNCETSPSRKVLENLWKHYPKYLDIRNSAQKWTKWMSLHELVETYWYLLDVEWRWWSARLKLLLFSWRPVFVQERKWKDHVISLLEPYKHYIPVKNDFSDFIEKIEKYFDSDLAFEIWKNWQKFSMEELNKDKAYHYIYSEFLNLKKINYNNIKIFIVILIRIVKKCFEYGKSMLKK